MNHCPYPMIDRKLVYQIFVAYPNEPDVHRVKGFRVIDESCGENLILEPDEPRLADAVHLSGQCGKKLVVDGSLNVSRHHVFKLKMSREVSHFPLLYRLRYYLFIT